MTSFYNINSTNCFVPSGSVLAYIGSTNNSSTNDYAIRYTLHTDTFSGTTIKEDVTNSYNATLVNGATIVSDSGSRVSGQGYLNLLTNWYIMESSQYVTLPAFTTGTNELTFSFWFRSSSTGTWGRVFDFGNGAGSDNIIVYINSNNIGFSVYVNTTGVINTTTVSVNDNVWRHVVWTLTNNSWKIYINGILHTTYTTGIGYPRNISRTINYLGRSNWTTDPYFDGGIADFRFYNRAVSGIEVSYIYYNTTDPDGWVIADGNPRTTSDIYNNLVTLSIGSRDVNSKYVPPNLNGAFLRGTGTSDISNSYVGTSLLTQQSHALKNHLHTATQAAHNHGTTPLSSNTTGSSGAPSYGLGSMGSTSTTNAPTDTGDQVNVSSYAGLVIKNAQPTITVYENTNNESNTTETRPFSYGVVWIIKI